MFGLIYFLIGRFAICIILHSFKGMFKVYSYPNRDQFYYIDRNKRKSSGTITLDYSALNRNSLFFASLLFRWIVKMTSCSRIHRAVRVSRSRVALTFGAYDQRDQLITAPFITAKTMRVSGWRLRKSQRSIDLLYRHDVSCSDSQRLRTHNRPHYAHLRGENCGD